VRLALVSSAAAGPAWIEPIGYGTRHLFLALPRDEHGGALLRLSG
jgi:hypothetical protein